MLINMHLITLIIAARIIIKEYEQLLLLLSTMNNEYIVKYFWRDVVFLLLKLLIYLALFSILRYVLVPWCSLIFFNSSLRT